MGNIFSDSSKDAKKNASSNSSASEQVIDEQQQQRINSGIYQGLHTDAQAAVTELKESILRTYIDFLGKKNAAHTQLLALAVAAQAREKATLVFIAKHKENYPDTLKCSLGAGEPLITIKEFADHYVGLANDELAKRSKAEEKASHRTPAKPQPESKNSKAMMFATPESPASPVAYNVSSAALNAVSKFPGNRRNQSVEDSPSTPYAKTSSSSSAQSSLQSNVDDSSEDEALSSASEAEDNNSRRHRFNR